MSNKKYKSNINIFPTKTGKKRIEELKELSDAKTVFLPPNISIEDMDISIKELIEKNNLKLIVDGKNVPVIMSLDRFAERKQVFHILDENKNPLMPYITLYRKSLEEGTIYGKRWNIAQNKNFRFVDVPYNDNGQYAILRYKIPQPTSMDLIYEIKLFTRFMRDMNIMDELYMNFFNPRQGYINIKGHYMPVVMESTETNSNLKDLNEDRFFEKTITIRLMGYTQNQDYFTTEPLITNVTLKMSINENP